MSKPIIDNLEMEVVAFKNKSKMISVSSTHTHDEVPSLTT